MNPKKNPYVIQQRAKNNKNLLLAFIMIWWWWSPIFTYISWKVEFYYCLANIFITFSSGKSSRTQSLIYLYIQRGSFTRNTFSFSLCLRSLFFNQKHATTPQTLKLTIQHHHHNNYFWEIAHIALYICVHINRTHRLRSQPARSKLFNKKNFHPLSHIARARPSKILRAGYTACFSDRKSAQQLFINHNLSALLMTDNFSLGYSSTSTPSTHTQT